MDANAFTMGMFGGARLEFDISSGGVKVLNASNQLVNTQFKDINITGNVTSDGRLDVSGNSYLRGNVGVGTISPEKQLDIFGDFKAARYFPASISYGAFTNSWSTRSVPVSAENKAWNSIVWSPELSIFVAVGTNCVMTSPNGSTWTTSTALENINYSSVTWSPELSLFVAVASNGTGNRVMTSPNGINWTGRTSPTFTYNSVTWSPQSSIFVAVGSPSSTVITSPNGINWTSRTVPVTGGLMNSIVWSPELSIFVAVGYDGSHTVITSPDGINWTARNGIGSTGTYYWSSVTWSPKLSIFAAVALLGAGVMTSPDGITWTKMTATDAGWLSVTWAPELGIFVSVAPTRIMTSTDSITWTVAFTVSGHSVVWSSELGIFVVLVRNRSDTVYTNSATKTVISASTKLLHWEQGNLGINTATPSNTLHVVGTTQVTRLGIGSSSPNGVLDVGGGDSFFRGNVGIGSSTSVLSYTLQLNTDSAAKPSTSTWTVSCDARLKEDIQMADISLCYSNIKALPLKYWKWRDDLESFSSDNLVDRHKLGWIAQDVETYIPKAVETKPSYGLDDCKWLNSDQIYATLYGAVQKLIEENEALKERVTQLEQA